MKRLLLLLLLGCSFNLMAQQPVLHYDFRGDSGRLVTDKSGSHFDGKLCGSAELDGEGVYLGNEDGYIDMGAAVGVWLQGMRQFQKYRDGAFPEFHTVHFLRHTCSEPLP